MGAGVALSAVERSEVEALYQLKLVPRLGERGIRRLVERLGSGRAALAAAGRQGDLWPKEGSRRAPKVPWTPTTRVLPMTSPLYPARLLELPDPPPLLFLDGDEKLLSRPCVAVVGSRRATQVGRRAAEALGRILSAAGVTVVSGLALGIDGHAHRGALAGGGRTAAVLGSGLLRIHPASHRRLAEEMRERGLLVSEFNPEDPALPHHFPKRNRIIAALAQAVVVVEAGKKSGALITVDHALDLGRDILAVPGSIENAQARGTNALLRDGARVLSDPEAVLDELEPLLSPMGAQAARASAQPPVPPELECLWDALSFDPRTVDELARGAELPVPVALAGLSTLELEGWVQQCPGMRFRRSWE